MEFSYLRKDMIFVLWKQDLADLEYRHGTLDMI